MFHFRRRHAYSRPILRFGRHTRPTFRIMRRRTTNFSPNVHMYHYGPGGDRNRSSVFSSYTPDQTPTAPEPDAKTLTVNSVDFKVSSNTKAHHTDEYDITKGFKSKLVIRRGQPFNIQFNFSKPYNSKEDDLRLIFEAGEHPQRSKGTQVEFILSAEDKTNEWGAKILSQKDKELIVTVFTPPTCFVGKWEFKVDIIRKDNANMNRYRYTHDDEIYIIFNPWCRDDTVYMEDETLLKEYIMNESGRIFVGNSKRLSAKPWNFGQFESCVLDVAMYLLELGALSWSARGNPIILVRKISALVNSSDEGGVLVGNWSGDYSGGKSPLSWTGSVAILKQYWETKQPVAFGQCWVFSGVTTTVLRALGIPARSVTNFSSAHDTDGSITIDYHYLANGEPDSNEDIDSVWNFHVWNECWMARPDLPQGYGGWQCIDATPQEASDNVYCCGPVSVAAVKHGEVGLPYDGPFVFAEVNADKVHWIQTPNGYEPVRLEKKVVGKYISTKAPNSSQREDITNNYKPEEGSAAERAAVMKANQVGSTRTEVYKETSEDVVFKIDQDSENTWVGQDFVVALTFENKSKQTRTINGRIVIKSMYYTGVTGDMIKSVPFNDIQLQSGGNSYKKVVMTENEYGEHLKDCCMFDVSFWGTVRETNQIYTAKEDYRLRKPHLTVKAPKNAVVGKEFNIDLSFTNPLNKTLTGCEVEIDGLAETVKFPQKNCPPKSTFNTSVHVTPIKRGNKELIVMFSSKQLDDINSSYEVFVKDS